MPNRIIKETIKESAQIDSLTWFEEVLFYRLIVTADDYGCVDGRIALLRSKLFPLKDNVTKKAVEDAITHLVSTGLLCRYTVNGTPYLLFPTWGKHQRVRNQHRKYPEPPADIVNAVTCQTNGGQMTADCLSESNPIQSESNPNPKEKEHAHKYGSYKNVLLTDEDLQKLQDEFPDWEERIERLSEYMASSGKTYKSCLATIRVWARKDKAPTPTQKRNAPPSGNYTGRDDTDAFLQLMKEA